MEASSGQFLRLLYVEVPLDNFLRLLYAGPPSGQFLRLLYGARPLRSISLLPMWGPLQISFFAYYIGGPVRSFSSPIRGPQFSFFTYYMGPPQINFFASYVGASSDQFLRILYSGPPQVIFFAYRGPSVKFLRILYGPPLRSISLLPRWGPLQISFFAYYIGGLFRSISSRTICGGPLR